LSRADRRSLGRRKLRRKVRKDVDNILELADKGFSRATIASTLGLRVEFVHLIFERVDEAREYFANEAERGSES
jgi:hypothetical protein